MGSAARLGALSATEAAMTAAGLLAAAALEATTLASDWVELATEGAACCTKVVLVASLFCSAFAGGTLAGSGCVVRVGGTEATIAGLAAIEDFGFWVGGRLVGDN